LARNDGASHTTSPQPRLFSAQTSILGKVQVGKFPEEFFCFFVVGLCGVDLAFEVAEVDTSSIKSDTRLEDIFGFAPRNTLVF
jgi:hypothetical protein